jgi:hypothetical protein
MNRKLHATDKKPKAIQESKIVINYEEPKTDVIHTTGEIGI